MLMDKTEGMAGLVQDRSSVHLSQVHSCFPFILWQICISANSTIGITCIITGIQLKVAKVMINDTIQHWHGSV